MPSAKECAVVGDGVVVIEMHSSERRSPEKRNENRADDSGLLELVRIRLIITTT